ncbi:MAG: hypothetical protein ACT4P2_11035 [Pseudomonadota bacterium]
MAVLLVAQPAAAGAGKTVLVGPERDSYHAIFGPNLAKALASHHTVGVEATEGGAVNIARVAADPNVIAVSQRDFFQRYRARHPTTADEVEFYGSLPVCAFAVARRNSPFATLAEIGVERPGGRPVAVDVGPRAGEAEATFATLQVLEPGLVKVKLEYRGAIRALARVADGQADVAFFLAFPDPSNPSIRNALDSEALTFLPIDTPGFLRPLPGGESLYTLHHLRWRDRGLIAAERTLTTLCTAMGVVVNTKADGAFVDLVAREALAGRLMGVGERSWSDAVGDFVEGVIAKLGGALESVLTWLAPRP